MKICWVQDVEDEAKAIELIQKAEINTSFYPGFTYVLGPCKKQGYGVYSKDMTVEEEKK